MPQALIVDSAFEIVHRQRSDVKTEIGLGFQLRAAFADGFERVPVFEIILRIRRVEQLAI